MSSSRADAVSSLHACSKRTQPSHAFPKGARMGGIKSESGVSDGSPMRVGVTSGRAVSAGVDMFPVCLLQETYVGHSDAGKAAPAHSVSCRRRLACLHCAVLPLCCLRRAVM